jgi:hypothetical protein
MSGDRVEILVDVGDGVRSFEVTATRDGRRVDLAIARGTVEVAEVARSGQVVRSARLWRAGSWPSSNTRRLRTAPSESSVS